MNLELAAMLCVTRRLPRVRGCGRVAVKLREQYVRKPRPKEYVDVMGFRVELDPMDLCGGGVMFAPQLYHWREVAYLRRGLSQGSVFLDLGCGIGFYSLLASRIVGTNGRVVAVDHDPHSFHRYMRTVRENGIGNVHAVQVRLSDSRETLECLPQISGNRGGSCLPGGAEAEAHTVLVGCSPLLDVLESAEIERVDAAKLDLEGSAFRVLSAFFRSAQYSLWPRLLVVIEHVPERLTAAGGDVAELLAERGYSLLHSHDGYFVWSLGQV